MPEPREIDDPRTGPVAPEDAGALLAEAEGAGGARRLEVLEELHAALQEELDADQAPPAGR